jgi:hypothetical protein
LRDRARDALAELMDRLAPARALAGRLEPHVVAYAEREGRAPLPFARKIPVESMTA